MEDTEKGGLSSITPTSSFAQKLQAQTSESQQILDAHRKRLMDLMSSRKQMPFDPSMMALAAGLLAPTKTGGFGESLGYGMSGYAAEAEKQFRREQEEAKLAYELEVGAQQQKRELMGQQLMAEMFGGEEPAPVPQVAKAEAPPAAPPAAKVEATAEAPAAAPAEVPVEVTQSAQAQTAQAAKALDMPELALPAIPRNKIARMTDEQIAMLKSFNPSMGKILEEYRKAFRENRQLQISEVNLGRQLQELELAKRKDVREEKKIGFEQREVEVKEASVPGNLPGVGEYKMPLSRWKELDSLTKSKDFNKLLNFYRENNLPVNTIADPETGKLRFMTENERNVKAKKDEARFTQKQEKYQIPEYGVGEFNLTPVQYDDYLTAKAQAIKFKDPNILQHWFNSSPFSGFVVSGATIGTKLNSPELTNPQPVSEAAPKPETAEKPAAEPSVSKEAAPAPAPAPADKRVVAEAAPPTSGTAGATNIVPKVGTGTGRVLSAQDLERQMKAEEQQREFQRLQEEARLAEEKRQREAQARLKEAQPIEESKKTAEVNIEAEKRYSEVAFEASNTFNTANRVTSLINDPRYSGAQGYFSKPGFTNAMVTFLDNGFKVGNWTIGFPAVGEALKKLGMTQDEVNAEAAILRDTGELSLKASKGLHQGAISDFERKLFGQISGSASTPLIAMKSLMEFTKAQAVYDQELYKAFQVWRDKNPSMIATRFMGSPEQKKAEAAYYKQLQNIQSIYFGTKSSSSAQSGSDRGTAPRDQKDADNKARNKFK